MYTAPPCRPLLDQDSDHYTLMLWDLTLNTVLELSKRMLMLDEGLPRRRTLLLAEDKEVGKTFLGQLRRDLVTYGKVAAKTDEWAKSVVKSSPFTTRPVQQLCLCLEDEGWEDTPRISFKPHIREVIARSWKVHQVIVKTRTPYNSSHTGYAT